MRDLQQILATVVAAVVLSIFAGDNPRASHASTFVSQQVATGLAGSRKLENLLSTRDVDQIIRGLNDIKQDPYRRELLTLLDDLWNGRIEKYPELPWDIVNREIVRIEIGNILIQADNNGKFESDRESIQRFAFEMVDHEDIDVAMAAIFTLALIERDLNVQKLFTIAQDGRSRLFRSAVVGMATMCGPEADLALEQLMDQESDETKREYISDVRKRYQSNKAFYCE